MELQRDCGSLQSRWHLDSVALEELEHRRQRELQKRDRNDDGAPSAPYPLDSDRTSVNSSACSSVNDLPSFSDENSKKAKVYHSLSPVPTGSGMSSASSPTAHATPNKRAEHEKTRNTASALWSPDGNHALEMPAESPSSDLTPSLLPTLALDLEANQFLEAGATATESITSGTESTSSRPDSRSHDLLLGCPASDHDLGLHDDGTAALHLSADLPSQDDWMRQERLSQQRMVSDVAAKLAQTCQSTLLGRTLQEYGGIVQVITDSVAPHRIISVTNGWEKLCG